MHERIQSLLIEGSTKEEIYMTLLKEGHTVDAIQQAFSGVSAGHDAQDTQKRTVSMIVMIGALLVGAGIFSFIAANWQYMDKVLKVSIILISMVASYTLGWLLRQRWGYGRTGEAFILLGIIIYGAGIFLVAQIFNIQANWPDGFILWMLGVMVMAFAIDFFALLYVAIPLGFIAVWGHPFVLFERNTGLDPFLFTSSVLLVVATVAMFITGHIIRKRVNPDITPY